MCLSDVLQLIHIPSTWSLAHVRVLSLQEVYKSLKLLYTPTKLPNSSQSNDLDFLGHIQLAGKWVREKI